MVHETNNLGYDVYVPQDEEIEMITVGHPEAELLKVFLHKQEKKALKELAAEQGVPMYHIVRELILNLLEQRKKPL
jgi:hypothetical protein